MKRFNDDGTVDELWGMYLWSNPSIPHLQRLVLGVYYLPLLFWWWLTGKPIELGLGPRK